MQETIRLFDEDTSITQFEGCVLSCEEQDGLYKVVLNQTAFFPEEGGQSSDDGTLMDIPVENVTEADRVIYHWLKEPLWEGDTVEGLIDEKKRFSDMQQHSGEHIVSGLVHRLYGLDNVGFHLGSQWVTMDFNGILTKENLMKIEHMANEAVAKNLPVQVAWPSKEELSELDYRSKKELEGPVRIVTIPGYDCCACCAPHVRATGEIGMIKLTSMEKYKGGVRIYMLCGFRALEDYNRKQENNARISALLSAKPDETADAVEKLKKDNAALSQQLSEMTWQLVKERLSHTERKGENICFFDSNLNKNMMKRALNELTGMHSGLCGCFMGDDQNGYAYLIGSKNLDAAESGKAMNAGLNGRGGGNAKMFQGTVTCTRQDIEKFFENI